jgi:hypothetical protein
MATVARARFGGDDALAVFLHEQWASFSTGRVVYLDQVLPDAVARQRFLVVFDAATEEIRREHAFTELGEKWIDTEIMALRHRIAAT